MIPDATTNEYTPTEDDLGYFIMARARYIDPMSDPDDSATPAEDERVVEGDVAGSLRVVMLTTTDCGA